MIYINPYLSVPINTIIGGVAGAISTKSALATTLAISESIIRRFEIIGADIHCHISANYNIGNSAFYMNSNLKKYIDYDGRVLKLEHRALSTTGLTEIYLPKLNETKVSQSLAANDSLTQIILPELILCYQQIFRANTALVTLSAPKLESIIGDKSNCFASLTSLTLFNMPKLKVYGDPALGNGITASGFNALKTGCEIRVHEFMKTSNAGSPDAALVWVKANRAAIVKFYDDAGNYVSTL